VYYGDTDSLLFKVKSKNFLEDWENGEYISSQMNFTNRNESFYPELVEHQAPNLLVMLKSETGSDLIYNGVFSGPKVYSLGTQNKDFKQVCKSVPTHFVKNNLDMSLCRNCSSLVPRGKVMMIHSLQFKNYTVRVEKSAMSAISDKVYVREGGVKVLPHGHYCNSDLVECIYYKKQPSLDKSTYVQYYYYY
jgi:hypothetical protein